jgi:hypothetical protein
MQLLIELKMKLKSPESQPWPKAGAEEEEKEIQIPGKCFTWSYDIHPSLTESENVFPINSQASSNEND